MEQPVIVPVEQHEDQDQTSQAQAMLALFRAWEDEDPEEQRETLAYLQQALNEDRPGARKLFP